MSEPRAVEDEGALAEDLLQVLRRETGHAELSYEEQPAFIASGSEARVYAFRLGDAPRELSDPLVLRLLKPHVDSEQVRLESAIHAGLTELRFPVPRILLAHAEPAALGARFQVMTRVAGRVLLQEVLDTPADALLRQPLRLPRLIHEAVALVPGRLAATQIRLHALDPAPLERALAEYGLSPQQLRLGGRLDQLDGRIQSGSFGGLEPVMRWLRARQPESRGVSICHGDLVFTNICVADGEVAGVFDWSKTTLADPAFDVAATLARLRSDLPGLPAVLRAVQKLLARRYLAAYRRQRSVDAGALRTYEVFWLLHELLYGLEHARAGDEPTGLVQDRWLHAEVQTNALARLSVLTGARISAS